MVGNLMYSIVAFLLFEYAIQNSGAMNQEDKPNVYIGYYLKTVDNLLTQKMDSIHSVNGVTRAEWQILNGVAEKPKIERGTLLKAVQEFTDFSTAQRLLEKLIGKGLITDSAKLELTDSGQAVYSKSLNMQKAFRVKAMEGVSQSEYQNVINTLDKMIQNLTEQK